MDAFTQLCIATIVFVGGHFLFSSSPLRSVLVRRLGDRAFQGLFSVIALGSIVWMSIAYGEAVPDRHLYWLGATGQYAALVLMLVALILIVGGLSTKNPTMAGTEGGFDRADIVNGVLRISRNPFLWGVGIWGVGHLLANGDTASLVMFGGLTLLAVVGSAAIDAKYSRREPEAYARFAAVTSNLPFAAILAGRQSFARAAAEFGWWRLAIVIVVYAAIVHLHGWAFGVPAWPV